MLEDLRFYRDHALRQAAAERERRGRSGAHVNPYIDAAARVYGGLDVSTIDAALAGLQQGFSTARRRLQRGKTDGALNSAVLELTEVAAAARYLLENVYFVDGKQVEEAEW